MYTMYVNLFRIMNHFLPQMERYCLSTIFSFDFFYLEKGIRQLQIYLSAKSPQDLKSPTRLPVTTKMLFNLVTTSCMWLLNTEQLRNKIFNIVSS